jgi:hypothetical protein
MGMARMGGKNRIMAADQAETGRRVNTGFRYSDPEEVPGAVLSPSSAAELRQELQEIDEAQHAALATGDRYYLGARPRS